MQPNPHLLMRVERYGARPASASAVVVLVHGRALSPEHMHDNVVSRLDRADIAYLAPAAADETWYPTSFLSPIASNQPGIDHSMAALARIRDELLDDGVPHDRIVWCGFSQGACVVSQFLSLHPARWGGLLAFTGGLIGPPGTSWTIDGDFGGMPAYFSASDVDEFVPEQRTRETAERFAAAGARVSIEIFLGREHEISAVEVERARLILSCHHRRD